MPAPAVPSSMSPVAAITRSRSARNAVRKSRSRLPSRNAARVSASSEPVGSTIAPRWNCSIGVDVSQV